MKPISGTQTRWLLALCGATLAVATSGCSMLIATNGVSSMGEIYEPETRAEVREAFGEADETRTFSDGRTVERRAIRQQVKGVCKWEHGRYSHSGSFDAELGCLALAGAYEGSLGLVDVFLVPVMAVKSEQAKLHYVFVYGADDRVLSRYDIAALLVRFREEVLPLTDSLTLRLKEGGYPSWDGCLSAFGAESFRIAVVLRASDRLHRGSRSSLQGNPCITLKSETGSRQLQHHQAGAERCL